MNFEENNIVPFGEYRARHLLVQGLDEIRGGDHEKALNFFKQSIRLEPTAEAHTYSGWMLNSLGENEKAIEECYKAIELDPLFGSPYNDIGVYKMKEGNLNEAIRWFHKAIDAPDNDSRQLSHINLGKIYMSKKTFRKALYHLREALEIDPGNRDLEEMVLDLEDKLN